MAICRTSNYIRFIFEAQISRKQRKRQVLPNDSSKQEVHIHSKYKTNNIKHHHQLSEPRDPRKSLPLALGAAARLTDYPLGPARPEDTSLVGVASETPAGEHHPPQHRRPSSRRYHYGNHMVGWQHKTPALFIIGIDIGNHHQHREGWKGVL